MAGVTGVLVIAGAGVFLAFTGTSRPEREQAPASGQVTRFPGGPGVPTAPGGSAAPAGEPSPGPAGEPSGGLSAGASGEPFDGQAGRHSGWRRRVTPPRTAGGADTGRRAGGLVKGRESRPDATGLPALRLEDVRPQPTVPRPADSGSRPTGTGRGHPDAARGPAGTGPGPGSTATGTAERARRGDPARRSGSERSTGSRPSLTPPPGNVVSDGHADAPGPPAHVGANPCATFHDLRRRYCEQLLGR